MEKHWVEVGQRGSNLHPASPQALVRVIIESSLHRDYCTVIRSDPILLLISSYNIMLSFVPNKKLVLGLE